MKPELKPKEGEKGSKREREEVKKVGERGKGIFPRIVKYDMNFVFRMCIPNSSYLSNQILTTSTHIPTPTPFAVMIRG